MFFRLSYRCLSCFTKCRYTRLDTFKKKCFFPRRLSLLSILKKLMSNFVKAAPRNVDKPVIFEHGASIL